MNKKIILAVVIAALSISICACGRPDKKSSTTDSGSAVTTERKERKKRVTHAPEIKEHGEYEDLSELKGTFIETIDGEETNYIFINGLGTSQVAIGSKSPTPIGIVTSDDGLMVYRGSQNPGDAFVPYKFDGKTLEFTYTDDAKHVWTKTDTPRVEGEYKLLDNYGSVAGWTFNTDGKLTIRPYGSSDTESATFTQTADKITITDAQGKKTEYDYEFDVFSLSLKNGDEELYFNAEI